MLFWSGQSVSEIGSAVTVLALPLAAVAILRASTFSVDVLSAMTTGPHSWRSRCPPGGGPRAQARPWHGTTAGLSFARRGRSCARSSPCTGTANLFGSMMAALEIIFLVRVLHVRPAYTGYRWSRSPHLAGRLAGRRRARHRARIGPARINLGLHPRPGGLAALLIPLAQPGSWASCYVVGLGRSLCLPRVLYNVAQVSATGRRSARRRTTWDGMNAAGPLDRLGHPAPGRPSRRRPGQRDRESSRALWAGAAGAWASGLWVFFSPLRGMRDIPARPAAGSPTGHRGQR